MNLKATVTVEDASKEILSSHAPDDESDLKVFYLDLNTFHICWVVT